jgi:hypothetical protein
VSSSTFYDVGSALSVIREQRLYRESHGTFEDYCSERWGLKRQRAYELMGAASVVFNLSEISDKPRLESHAAELVPLPDRAQAAAWTVTTESSEPVTAARVREVVDAAKTSWLSSRPRPKNEPDVAEALPGRVICATRARRYRVASGTRVRNSETDSFNGFTPRPLRDTSCISFDFRRDTDHCGRRGPPCVGTCRLRLE